MLIMKIMTNNKINMIKKISCVLRNRFHTSLCPIRSRRILQTSALTQPFLEHSDYTCLRNNRSLRGLTIPRLSYWVNVLCWLAEFEGVFRLLMWLCCNPQIRFQKHLRFCSESCFVILIFLRLSILYLEEGRNQENVTEKHFEFSQLCYI